MALLSGTRLRDYEIKSLIGKGGMGEVYMAEDVNLGRKVAIKLLHTQNAADPNHLKRFLNEAKVQARLVHPNIVALHSFFEEGGAYYLVMQYAPGITLSQLIRRTGPIPEHRAMRIFTQIAEALGYAHSEGVVHRDIKPSNIMIDPDRNDRVMVMDFGIARMISAEHITRTGTQMGTPCYMSPEQVLGEKDIDSRSDIYSAGVVLYEMLSGSIPYDLNTESLYKVQDRILKEALPDPRLAYEYISASNVELIRMLTQKDPKDRPPNIIEAVKDPVRISPQIPSPLWENEDPHQVEYEPPPVGQPIDQSQIADRPGPPAWQPDDNEDLMPGHSSNRTLWMAIGYGSIVVFIIAVLFAVGTCGNNPDTGFAGDFSQVGESIEKMDKQVKELAAKVEAPVEDPAEFPSPEYYQSDEAYKANIDALDSDVNNFAASVYQYWKTPQSQGGAGQDIGSISDYSIARYLGISSSAAKPSYNENGRYWLSVPAPSDYSSIRCVITGIGREAFNGKNTKVEVTVYLPEGTVSTSRKEVTANW